MKALKQLNQIFVTGEEAPQDVSPSYQQTSGLIVTSPMSTQGTIALHAHVKVDC